MIKQMLLFKFKEGASGEQIENCFERYRDLVGATALLSVEIGANQSTEGFDKGFTHAAIASFKDNNAVQEFLVHPAHVAFAEKILNPLLEDFLLVEIKT